MSVTAVVRPLVSTRSSPRPRRIGAVALVGATGALLIVSQLSVEAFLWLSAAALAISAAYPFLRWRSRKLDPGEAIYFFVLYYTLSLLLRGLGLIAFVDSPYLTPIGDAQSPAFRSLLGWTFFYSALGLVALYAGYGSRLAARIGESVAANGMGWKEPWDRRRLGVALVTLFAVGFAGITARVHSVGGFTEATSDPVATGTTEALGHFWTIALTEFAVVGFHVWVLGMILRRRPGWAWRAAIVGLALAAPLYLVSSSKFLLLRLGFPPLLFSHFLVRRFKLAHLIGIFVGFGALFPFFYAYRSLGLGGLDAMGLYLETTDQPWLKLYNRSYSADSFMLILHRTGPDLPFQWGGSLSDLLTFFVPRALWPGKPQSFGLTFPEHYMPHVDWGGLTYVTPSLPGELYLNFHVAGIVLGLFAMGIALRAAWCLASTRSPGALLAYAYFFLSAVHVAEGAIASQIELLLLGIVPAWLAQRWLQRRSLRKSLVRRSALPAGVTALGIPSPAEAAAALSRTVRGREPR